MHQLRLTTIQSRDVANPLSRLLIGAVGLLVAITAIALLLIVILPLIGVLISAAVGGVILAIAGLVLMVPLFLVAGTVVTFVHRGHSRRADS
jgi:hypothetical protein